jgi:hypothetical protein
LDGYRRAAAGGLGRTLCIAVVNARRTDPREVIDDNARLLETLEASGPAVARITGPHAGSLVDAGDFDLLVVDRTSEGRRFDADGGVGLARKIGADIAVRLITASRSDRFVYFSDADATLPPDYFEACTGVDRSVAAIVFPFWHERSGHGRIDEATALYEISLRYYVAGLAWAGSPYAFHTLGSALAVDASAYASVRGVPRLRAAEDFYLLNKVAKVGAVARAACTPIRIECRDSRRVPFGTGARVGAMLDSGGPLLLYAPETFSALRSLLGSLNDLARGASVSRFWDRYRSPVGASDRAVAAILERFGAPHALDRLSRQHAPGPPLAARLREWFDGFRTLKLIHHLRQTCHPSIPLLRALESTPFCASAHGVNDLVAIRLALLSDEASGERARPGSSVLDG